MRSFLFVPGDSERKLFKATSSSADVIMLDLEDAVADEQKARARELIYAFLKNQAPALNRDIYIRINGVDSQHIDADLDCLSDALPSGIMLPKVTSIDDIEAMDRKLCALEARAELPSGTLRLIAMITETPLSILTMNQYLRVPARTYGFAWSGEDLAAALGAKDNRDADGGYTDPFRLARALTLMTASAAGVQAIDAVFTDFRNIAGLTDETKAAARDGFSGKLAIHPDQVEAINEAFTPSAEEVESAKSVIAAFDADDGVGVIGLDNKMMDLPNLIIARNILHRAKLAGKV